MQRSVETRGGQSRLREGRGVAGEKEGAESRFAAS